MTNENYDKQQRDFSHMHQDGIPQPELGLQLQSLDELKDIELSTKSDLGKTILEKDKYAKLFAGEPGQRFYRYYQEVVDRIKIETTLTDVLDEFGVQMDISGENPKYLNTNKGKIIVDKGITENIRGYVSIHDENMRLKDRYTRKATFASLAHYKTHPGIQIAEATFAHEDSHLDLFAGIRELQLKPQIKSRSLFDLKNLLSREKKQDSLEKFNSIPEYQRAIECHALLVNINFHNYQDIARSVIKDDQKTQFQTQEDVDSSYKPLIALKALGYSQKQIVQILAQDFKDHDWNDEKPYTYVNSVIQSGLKEGEDMDQLVDRFLIHKNIQRLKASRIAIEVINSYDDDPEANIDTAQITLDDLKGE